MKGKLFALAASLALHLLFALALITLANWAARFTPPSIEVSAIEFSFAELDSPAPPAMPPPEPPPSPPQPTKPPEREAPDIPAAQPPPPPPETSKPPEREALNIQDAPASNLQAAEPPNLPDAPASNFQAAQPPNIQDAPASNLQAAEPPNIPDAPASNFQAAQPPPPPPAQPPNQARIDAPPRPLKAIRPEYPKASRQRGEEGDVVVVLSINEQGHVDSASVAESSGYQELDAAAIRAANKARFSPAKRGRTAVASEARVTITFRLTGK